jgi:hypothetical protein
VLWKHTTSILFFYFLFVLIKPHEISRVNFRKTFLMLELFLSQNLLRKFYNSHNVLSKIIKWPCMAFEIKLHIMQNLRLYCVSIPTKF